MSSIRGPTTPEAFVAAAERATNERDLNAVLAVYAPDAVLELIADGARERHEGAAAIARAWTGYLRAFGRRDFVIRKTLVAAADGAVVNTWSGGFGAHGNAEGIEVWRLRDGAVTAHSLYSFFDVRPSAHPLARLRVAAAAPRAALTLLAEQRALSRRGR